MKDLQSYFPLNLLLWLSSTILILRLIITKTLHNQNLPPSPQALPIIGHIHLLLTPIPHQTFQKLSTQFGPLIALSFCSTKCLIVSSPETAKLFLQTHEASFSNRPRFKILKHLSYPNSDFTFGPYGPHWRLVRKLAVSRLLGGNNNKNIKKNLGFEIRRFLRKLLLISDEKGPILIGRELMGLTNDLVSTLSVGKRCEEAEEVRELVRERNLLVGGFNNLSDYLWFCEGFLDLFGFEKRAKEFHRKFDCLIERILREHEVERRRRRREGNGFCRGEDFVHVLLDVLEDDYDDKNSEMIRLGRDHIKAFILDIFVAGIGTTATTMEWSLAELIKNPKIMNKAREEIDTIVGKTRLVEESDIPNLPYLRSIVKETLRLHPAAPLVLRESSEDCIVNGYFIKKNTRVYINSWAIGRDSNIWEDPLEFRPERFLGAQESIVRGHNFNLLPFGSGRRVCPGASLALQVIQSSLAAMIQCFDWKAVTADGKNVGTNVDMEEGQGLALVRANPLICVAFPRLNPLPI